MTTCVMPWIVYDVPARQTDASAPSAMTPDALGSNRSSRVPVPVRIRRRRPDPESARAASVQKAVTLGLIGLALAVATGTVDADPSGPDPDAVADGAGDPLGEAGLLEPHAATRRAA